MQAGAEISILVILISSVITISAIEGSRNFPRIDNSLLTKRDIPNGCPSIISQCPIPEKQNATLLPNPSDCGSYCACSWGNIYLMPCPATLFFNPISNVCDWPAASGCHPGPARTTDDAIRPSQTPATDEKTDLPPEDGSTIPAVHNGCAKVQDLCQVSEKEYGYLLPNPDDCGSFCACSHGNIYLMNCPHGLYFNPILHVCDWPELSGCPSNGTTQPPSDPATKDSTETSPSAADQTTLPPPTNGCENVKDMCPVPEHQNATLLPNSADCGSYCACSNGEIFLMPCPKGLYFNPILHVCDWPESSGCNLNESSHFPTGTTATPTKSTVNSNETTTTPTETTRPTSAVPQKTTEPTKQETQPTSYDLTPVTDDQTLLPDLHGCQKLQNECPVPEDGIAILLPNPDDCGSYCSCSNGDIYQMECPPGLYFNPDSHVCDWPESSGCPSNGTVQPPSGTSDSPPATTDGPTFPPSSEACLKVQHLCPIPDLQNATLLPNPDDCGSYCACNNGHVYLMPCPPGLYFNPVSKVCDWPESSGCPSNATELPPSGTSDSPPVTTDRPTLPPSSEACLKVQHLCPIPELQNATLLPNPDDCESYCACNNGHVYLMSCPPGLYFNPVSKVCDWPESSGCSANGTAQPPSGTSDSPPTTTDGPTFPPSSEACLKVQHLCPVPDLQNATLLPNPDDCGSYCACNNGHVYLMSCPPGLYFNPVSKVCDWPESSGCSANGTAQPPSGTSDSPPTTTDGPTFPPSSEACLKVQHLCPVPDLQNATLLPNPDDCGSYCACNNGHVYLMSCPPGLYFNPVSKVCDWPESSGCPSNATELPPNSTTDSPPVTTDRPTLPPSSEACLKVQHLCPVPELQNATLLPNPDDCESYCACNNGHVYLMSCPSGLYFNPVFKVCDWPELSGCPSNGTVKPPSESTETPIIETDGTSLPPVSNGCPKIQHWCPVTNHQNASLFPNPDDCGSYCACNNGHIYLMLCPAGLEFHPILRVCDWPSDVSCTPIDPEQGPPPSLLLIQ